jgi:2-dehydro-3-deoxyphosphogalactonate aldolase
MSPLHERLAPLPLIAILRGLEPDRAVEVGGVLTDGGFVALEVPLNSPRPFISIERLAEAFGERALIGAGTVRARDDVGRLVSAGGRLLVMPHADPAVIGEARRLGLLCIPGVATPSEAFAALDAGADALKLFPAEALPPPVVRAWRAVLPKDVWLLPVGGIRPETMAPFRAAGASGFGLGSALFGPGMDLGTLRANARAFVAAWGAGGPHLLPKEAP